MPSHSQSSSSSLLLIRSATDTFSHSCLSLGGHLFLSISIYLTLSVILPSSQLCSVSRSAVSQSSQSILSCTNAEPLHIHKGTDSSGLLEEDLLHAACLLPGVQASDMAKVCLANLFTLSLVKLYIPCS